MTKDCLDGIDVVVLAGGLGTRISGVLGETPKVLATINGRPYLDYLLDWFSTFGTARIVFCLGHLADKVTDHVAGRQNVTTVVEPERLGTGGAVQFARDRLASDPVFIMNGDTWLGTDLCRFLDSHRRSAAAVSVLCVPVDDVSRYGSVEIYQERIVAFREKDLANTGPGLISAGAYLMSQEALAMLEGPSLERDFLQRQPPRSVHGYVPDSIDFVDIGTPESLVVARSVFHHMK